MNDRELLELAAKAAGLNYSHEYGLCFDDEYEQGYEWNPLHDDGDALRLAVVCRIKWERHIIQPYIAAWASGVFGRFEEPEGTDPFAATRRAIVRAAAEIGKEMK